ncbi:MAG: DUF4921 family protein [Candidatus Sungbacteria bacterium]|nr:DUF4921 family protein [Candidatus Sungbacteria bacterium]
MSGKKKLISELRQDFVSGEWAVIATGRGKRPHDFLKQKREPFRQPKSGCPFEKLPAGVLAAYSLDEEWQVGVIPNKYPVFGRGVCSFFHRVGPYQWGEGVGFHEVVITRDHERSIGRMRIEEVELVIRAYQDRYLALRNDDCVEYISIFHNHGKLSGATISHPHSQIIAIPVIPPDVGRSLRGSADFFHENKTCVHCHLLKYELKVRDRVIYENDFFAVLAPFASKTAFEIRIYPKRHEPHFEMILAQERMVLADALRSALAKLFRGLKNPDYNFFLHTAPIADSKEFHHYHWHFEILPKTAIWAGFEIGTGIEISTIAPEKAAEFLRRIKI